jgi:hypothetical protein
MKKLTLALGAAALALTGTVAGIAVAQQHNARPARGMMADPFGNATVTRGEAQAKAGEIFAQLDANKDGKLDAADRQARRAARLGTMFDSMDTNKDGRIDKTEFTAAHQPPAAGQPGPMGGMQGMAGPGMGGHRMHGRGIDRPGMDRPGMGARGMGAMDGNGDRTITRDEFVSGAMKRFDAADANKDGKLTPDERRAAMRGGMGRRMAPPPPPPPAQAAPKPAAPKTAAPAL